VKNGLKLEFAKSFREVEVVKGRALSIQGAGVVGTGIGKSLTVALLCRLFSEDGYKVAPFKALNLTNVTYKDEEGGEFGYSQALQAIAAGVEPDYRMNPFTPKPLGKGRFDIILEGRIVERGYHVGVDLVKELFKRIVGAETFYQRVMESIEHCLKYLLANYDIVCIEGSGPSKLKGLGYFSKLLDLPNMEVAKLASAPVILLANGLDSAIATYQFLPEEERKMIKGVILNRFHYKKIEEEVVDGIGVPSRLFEYGIESVEREFIKTFHAQGISLEIIGNLPYFEELSTLPDIDPLVSDKRVDLDLWKQIIPRIAEKARKKINLKKIYKELNL